MLLSISRAIITHWKSVCFPNNFLPFTTVTCVPLTNNFPGSITTGHIFHMQRRNRQSPSRFLFCMFTWFSLCWLFWCKPKVRPRKRQIHPWCNGQTERSAFQVLRSHSLLLFFTHYRTQLIFRQSTVLHSGKIHLTLPWTHILYV